MILERARITTLVGEDEAPVGIDLPGAREIERACGALEAAPARQAPELAIEPEHPAVVATLEALASAAAVLPTQQRAAVGAAVGEHMDAALGGAQHDDGLAAQPPRDPVAGLGDLRLVPHENPAATNDAVDLVREDLAVGIKAAVHAPVLDQAAVVHGICVARNGHHRFLRETQITGMVPSWFSPSPGQRDDEMQGEEAAEAARGAGTPRDHTRPAPPSALVLLENFPQARRVCRAAGG
jgi:hypothetical protein